MIHLTDKNVWAGKQGSPPFEEGDKMRKIQKIATTVLLAAVMTGHCLPVLAAGGSEVTLNSSGAKEGEQQVKVTCDITGAENVTNGKIRILYDQECMSIQDTSEGSAMKGALCEINDCNNGNKEEGEIVFAFASSTPLAEDGTLIAMTFALSSEVKEGDIVNVKARVEKLSGDQDEYPVSESTLAIQIAASEDTENPVVTPTSTPEPSPAVKDKGGDGKKDGSLKVQNPSEKVKTGDATNLLFPAALLALSFVGLLGGVWLKAKKAKTD